MNPRASSHAPMYPASPRARPSLPNCSAKMMRSDAGKKRRQVSLSNISAFVAPGGLAQWIELRTANRSAILHSIRAPISVEVHTYRLPFGARMRRDTSSTRS